MNEIFIHPSDFDSLVIKRSEEIPVLIGFLSNAESQFSSINEDFANLMKPYKKSIDFLKVDGSLAAQLIHKYDIRDLPTIKAFYKGHVFESLEGICDKKSLSKFLNKVSDPETTILLGNASRRLRAGDQVGSFYYFQKLMQNKAPKDLLIYDGLKLGFNLGEFDLAKSWTDKLPKDFPRPATLENLKALLNFIEKNPEALKYARDIDFQELSDFVYKNWQLEKPNLSAISKALGFFRDTSGHE